MTSDLRYKKSALGDFYIGIFEDDKVHGSCCLAGGMPHLSAPQFCAHEEFGEKRYCYVKAQPQNDYEIYQMIRAAYISEFGCLRYAGNDNEIMQRLIDIGLAYNVCDASLPKDLTPIIRNYCSIKENRNKKRSIEDIANFLRHFLLNGLEKHSIDTKTTNLEQTGNISISFSYTWILEHIPSSIFTKISIQPHLTNFSDWLITHSVIEEVESMGVARNIGMSITIDDFLRESKEFTDLRWYTESEWQNGNPIFWRSTPY